MDSESSQKKLNKKFLSQLFDFLVYAGIAVLIIVPVRLFVAQPFIVSGASMNDTFKNSQYLIVDELSYRFHEPDRGDVLIFKYPNDHKRYFIKRLIAKPGETIEIKSNKVYIKNESHPNGFELKENYVKNMLTRDMVKTLGDHQYFVMGDNRNESFDSREWGQVDRSEIVGRAFLRLFPVKDFGVLPGKYSFNL